MIKFFITLKKINKVRLKLRQDAAGLALSEATTNSEVAPVFSTVNRDVVNSQQNQFLSCKSVILNIFSPLTGRLEGLLGLSRFLSSICFVLLSSPSFQILN